MNKLTRDIRYGRLYFMAGVTWNKMKHDVKVEKLNAEHKVLFGTLDALYKAMEDKNDRKALVKIINDLIAYTRQHFTTEESLLEMYNHPELEEQKKQHKLFIDKVEEFKQDYRNNHFMLHFNMAIFLKSWISNHIEILDRKYSQFLNDRGVF